MSVFDSFKNLDDITADKTERKEPGNTSSSASSQFFKSETEKEKEKTPEQPPAPNSSGPVYKMSEEKANMSGEANAYIVGGSIEFFWGVVETIVNRMSFSQSEKKHLLASRQKPKEKWTQEDKTINEKFDDLFKVHQQRKKDIEITERENKAMVHAYSLYARVTGKETDPEMIKWAAIISIMGNKGLKIYG